MLEFLYISSIELWFINSWLVSSGFGLLSLSTLITDQDQFLSSMVVLPLYACISCLFHLKHMQISLFLAFIDLFCHSGPALKSKNNTVSNSPRSFLPSNRSNRHCTWTPTKLFPSTCLLKLWYLCAPVSSFFHLLRYLPVGNLEAPEPDQY